MRILASVLLLSTLGTPAMAQIAPNQTAAGTNRALQLAPDSPFRDPDVIYLEADELINDERAQTLTAIGEVEGRYQDRTLRADRIDYDLTTGQVLATGNVVLIDATGDVQYADKIELSDQLQQGTAANFTARLASGATTAARFVNRTDEGEVELFNATYTACELCRNSEGEAKTPTWRLRARRVLQDEGSRTIRYRDAVIEVLGIPIFYTPYLAHPDPSQDRASGLLMPTAEITDSRGFGLVAPYYWAIDDYTEATITPRIYSKVNPLIDIQARRRFHTGEVNLVTSFTRATFFDRNGNSLDDPSLFFDPGAAEDGPKLSSHFFLDGLFSPNQTWNYGYTVMLQSDDLYLERYNLTQGFEGTGLIAGESRRNTSQAFIAGQGDNFRVSALAVGFQSLLTSYRVDQDSGLFFVRRDENDVLPIIAPRIQGEYYVDDPVFDGRLKLFGDVNYLTRGIGNDYGRATVGAEYSRTWIAPGGIEVKPFAWTRADRYDIETEAETELGFTRGIGQAGIGIRYPLVRRGESVDLIVEPRIQLTQSFGDPQLDEFFDPATGNFAFEDGTSPELDRGLLFEANKADGFDYFEEGRRADIGARVAAQFDMFGQDSEVSLFGGRSFAGGVENPFTPGSGLADTSSDYVGELDIEIGRSLTSNTFLRYDDDRGVFSRLDTTLSLSTERVSVSGRYFTINSAPGSLATITGAPQEEISGSFQVRPFGGWSLGYRIIQDLDSDITRSQRFTFGYRDDCTVFEVFYQDRDFNTDIIRNASSVGIRLTLKTLGSFGSR